MRRRNTIALLISLNLAVLILLGNLIYQAHERLTYYTARWETIQVEAHRRLTAHIGALDDTLRKTEHTTSPAVAADLGTALYARTAEVRLALGQLSDLTEEAQETKVVLDQIGQSARRMAQTGQVEVSFSDLRDAFGIAAPVFGSIAEPERLCIETAHQNVALFTGLKQGIFIHMGHQAEPCSTHIFRAGVDGGELTVEVRAQDGQILRAANTRTVRRSNLTSQEGLDLAQTFIADNGYTDTELHHWQTDANTVTATFFHARDDVIHYADRIDVTIGLDNGRMMGFDAKAYLTSHRARDIPEPQISLAQAMEAVPETLTVHDYHLALLPANDGLELLSFAFHCTDADGQGFLVYVSAADGVQEAIRLLTDDETGFFVSS